MQKTTLTCLAAGALALLLSACEFTVKGEVEHAGGGYPPSPSDPITPEPSSAYDCTERQVVRTEKIDDWNCSTPEVMEEAVTAFTELDEGVIRLGVKRLWDGTYPRLARLEYRSAEDGKPIRTLGCQLMPNTTEELNVRTFECILHGETTETSFTERFKFHRMILENESCKAKSIYQARMPDASCYRDAYYVDREYRYDVFLKGEKLPELFPTDIQ